MKNINDSSLDDVILNHGLIEASAGSGKTYTIMQLILTCIKNDVPLAEILIVTFTEKATSELKIRLREVLIEQQDSNPKFKEALNTIGLMNVSTIHGFCQKILQEYKIVCNVPYDFELINSRVLYQKIYQEHIRDFWHKRYDNLDCLTLLWDFNDSSTSPYSFFNLCNKILSSYKQGDKFTSYKKEYVDNFTSFYEEHNNKLQQYKNAKFSLKKKEITNFFQAETRYQQIIIAKGLMSSIDKFEQRDEPYIIFAQYLTFLKEAKFSFLCQVSIDISSEVSSYKEEHNLLDYDDLILLVRNALSIKNVFQKKLLKALQNKYSYALIDEFQDTDFYQWDIFKSIFLNQQNRLIAVGDKKQAIYSFRGSDIQAYTKAKDDILNAKGEIYTLLYNWRTHPKLLQEFNCLFVQDAWFGSSYIESKASIKDNLVDNLDEVLIFEEYSKGDYAKLAQNISSKIKQMLSNRIVYQENSTYKELQAKDICILVRNKVNIATLKHFLKQNDITYNYYKQRELYVSLQLENLKFFLKSIVFNDIKALKRVLVSELFAIEVNTFVDFFNLNEDRFLSWLKQWQALALKKQWQALFDDLFHKGILDEESEIYAIYQQIINDLIIVSYKYHYSCLELFYYLDYQYTNHNYIDEEKDTYELKDIDAIQIMTMHASKGLEFLAVFIYDLYSSQNKEELCKTYDKGHYIYDYSKNNDESIEEKKRLLYVSFTRAKLFLYAPFINKGFIYDSIKDYKTLEISSNIEKKAYTLDRIKDDRKQEKQKPIFTKELPPVLREVCSFSSLVHQIDLEKTFDEKHTVDSLQLIVPAGAITGQALHEILEDINYNLYYKSFEEFISLNQTVFINKLTKYNLASNRVMREVEKIIWQTINKKLPIINKSLIEIKMNYRWHEWDFLLSLNDKKLTIAKNYKLLKGFIDLVFWQDDVVYLLDYKSNALENYKFDSLCRVMHEHNYFLQYQLYSQALCKFLKKCKGKWRFGGSVYLFLRGINTDNDDGIFFDKYTGTLDFNHHDYRYLKDV